MTDVERRDGTTMTVTLNEVYTPTLRMVAQATNARKCREACIRTGRPSFEEARSPTCANTPGAPNVGRVRAAGLNSTHTRVSGVQQEV